MASENNDGRTRQNSSKAAKKVLPKHPHQQQQLKQGKLQNKLKTASSLQEEQQLRHSIRQIAAQETAMALEQAEEKLPLLPGKLERERERVGRERRKLMVVLEREEPVTLYLYFTYPNIALCTTRAMLHHTHGFWQYHFLSVCEFSVSVPTDGLGVTLVTNSLGAAVIAKFRLARNEIAMMYNPHKPILAFVSCW